MFFFCVSSWQHDRVNKDSGELNGCLWSEGRAGLAEAVLKSMPVGAASDKII